ncbi:hypothetical protein IJM86_00405 [bacterium]|nr:hypothetical protein [bacterium]
MQLFFVNTVEARSYPLKEITKGNIHELPFITNADYASKRGNGDYRSIYSVLWTASYYDGRDMGMGTHEGIDLAADL